MTDTSTSPARGGGLPCPVCKIDLVMSEKQGIEIDYCPTCRGVWLDRGELDKIIERSAAEQARQAPPPPPPRPSASRPPSGYDDHGYGRHGHGRRRSFLSDLFD